MTPDEIRVSREWLALREPADAMARSRDLVERLVRRSPPTGRWVIHDLGGGTGSMGRWLAPLLPRAQHWVVHDRDADLLEVAAASRPHRAADGSEVTVAARVIGDMLVPFHSASGNGTVRRLGLEVDRGRHLAGLHHFDLLNHPRVYAVLRHWLGR